METTESKRTARALVAAAVTAGAGVLAVAGTLAAPSAQAAPARSASIAAVSPLHVTRIAYGDKLRHAFLPNGKGTARTESLSSPDDIAELGGDIFVTFQNGVGPQGQAAPDGDLDSTIVEFTLSGREVAQWDLRGKCDGLSADPLAGDVIRTAESLGARGPGAVRAERVVQLRTGGDPGYVERAGSGTGRRGRLRAGGSGERAGRRQHARAGHDGRSGERPGVALAIWSFHKCTNTPLP